MLPSLKQLVAVRPRAPRMRRAARVARAPRPPRAAELAYVAALRGLVNKFNALVKEHIVPALPVNDHADEMRLDVLQPGLFGKFQLVKDKVGDLVADDSLLPTVNAAATRTAQYTAKEMSRVLGISFSTMRDLGGTLADFRAENVKLIQSMASDFVDRISNVLEQNTSARAEDVAAQLQDAIGVTKSKADLIAVDQTLKLNATITEKRQTAVGVVEYVWTTSHDERVRPSHRALDGTKQLWSSPPVVNDRGERLPPGKDIRCRCQAVPVIPEFDES